ncbi:MAG: tRNA 2-thiouridine(34) synthase MnmA [Phycisphaerales bacterium]|nr:tRNA 2-thiouridine(34) synthase MnmA [Phycisphaerales bacterium]
MRSRAEKVVVAMSGGVDSSVAAAILLREGYEVVGCYMRLGRGAADDAQDAQRVAAQLGIPLHIRDFTDQFGRVVDYFVSEYNAGRTPNPCIRCNKWLKFGKLREYAQQIGAAFVASGHHARVEMVDGRLRLLRGADGHKDQSYVLFAMAADELGAILLPVGGYEKARVRELAREFDLHVAGKTESQDICFIPDDDYAAVVKLRSPGAIRRGVIVDREGAVVGEHPGHQHFTIGQRRGVGVAMGYPIYVTAKDAQANTITVGQRADLASVGLRATGANWFVEPPVDWLSCFVKIRYNAAPVAATVRAMEHGSADGGFRSAQGFRFEVRFAEAQYAIAPGQAAVCYDADRCEVVLGGGWIDSALSV